VKTGAFFMLNFEIFQKLNASY